MEDEKLIRVCMAYRQLVRERSAKLRRITNPLFRIMPAITLVSLKIDLALLEEELCKRIKLGIDYAVQDRQKI